ncbi:MFS transporter [Streptomonospora salina]|uniref:MFS family permease n=1 Tax=Streptomonospora salina TaxID=104205 RepID=A0A841EAR0_9ACTN|nr:MFS transporter [Streptomonospora salina]MBB5998138.1 MFS family permease [Streptomonospora salina]
MTNRPTAPRRSTGTEDDPPPQARGGIRGAFYGYFVDFYDIYLPTMALAPAMVYFEPEHLDTVTSSTIYYITLAITLLGRPLGASIFGHMADSVGRKPATMVAVGGSTVITFLMMLMPGYALLGWFAIIGLILLRFVNGIFLGGIYTAAVPLAMESAPPEKRARVSTRIMLGYPLAFIVVSLVTTLMLQITPVEDGSYLEWGWRAPFVLSVVFQVAFLLYYRGVEEPPTGKRAKDRPSPLKELVARGPNRRGLMQVFVLMSGMWLSLQTAVSMMPGFLTGVLKVPDMAVTVATIVFFTVLMGAYLGIGRVADAWGRRPVLILFGVLTATVVPALYWLLTATAEPGEGVVATLVLAGTVVVVANTPWGILSAYIPERFPVEVRASGFGVGYTFAVIIPSLYSFFLVWLSHLMPYEYAQIPLVVLGGLLAVAGALMGPETKGADLAAKQTQRSQR